MQKQLKDQGCEANPSMDVGRRTLVPTPSKKKVGSDHARNFLSLVMQCGGYEEIAKGILLFWTFSARARARGAWRAARARSADGQLLVPGKTMVDCSFWQPRAYTCMQRFNKKFLECMRARARAARACAGASADGSTCA